MIMSKEDVLKKLAQITGKVLIDEEVYKEIDLSITCQDTDNSEEEIVDDASEVGDNNEPGPSEEPAQESSAQVKEYLETFGGELVNNHLLNSRQMTRKEYLQLSKSLKQEELLAHPLLYVMFRSEDQGEQNFFDWINRFKK